MSPTALTRRSAVLGLAAVPLLGPGATRAADGLPKVVVTKDPSCGCCSGWADHIRAAGFPVEIVESSELNRVKTRLGVPRDLSSCHTAEVSGFVVEGHVPAAAIKRLLNEKPQVAGLAVPGMPVGSPGMEVPGSAPELFEVIAFGPSGQKVFARFKGDQEV